MSDCSFDLGSIADSLSIDEQIKQNIQQINEADSQQKQQFYAGIQAYQSQKQQPEEDQEEEEQKDQKQLQQFKSLHAIQENEDEDSSKSSFSSIHQIQLPVLYHLNVQYRAKNVVPVDELGNYRYTLPFDADSIDNIKLLKDPCYTDCLKMYFSPMNLTYMEELGIYE